MDRLLLTVFGVALESFGDDYISATRAGESTVLGEGTEFDRALVSAFDFKNGVGDVIFLDEGLIGGIVEDDCLISLA